MVFKVNIPGPGPGRSRRISWRKLIRYRRIQVGNELT